MEGKGLRVFINDQSSQMLVIYKFLKTDIRNMNIVPPAYQPFFFLSPSLRAKQPPSIFFFFFEKKKVKSRFARERGGCFIPPLTPGGEKRGGTSSLSFVLPLARTNVKKSF
jgi:hypothetical protein